MSLWGQKADPAMHAMHFGYPIGSILSPILTANFLSPDDNNVMCNETTTSMSTCSPVLSTIATDNLDNSRVEIPYGMAGGVTNVMSTLFFGLTFMKPPPGYKMEIKPKESMLEVINPASCARGKAWYGIVMVTMMILWSVGLNGALAPVGSFGFTYATESDPFEKV